MHTDWKPIQYLIQHYPLWHVRDPGGGRILEMGDLNGGGDPWQSLLTTTALISLSSRGFRSIVCTSDPETDRSHQVGGHRDVCTGGFTGL